MTRLFSSTLTKPPIAKPIISPMKLYSPSTDQPLFATALIDWNSYNNGGAISAVGVIYNLDQGATTAQIGRILSVYIDNSASNVPVYVSFPDTGFEVVCGPGDTTTQTVITSGVVAKVYGVGFTGGPQPLTTVIFCNQVLQPSAASDFATFTPLYFCSTTNTLVPNNTAYRSLAVGDYTIIGDAQINATGTPVSNTPPARASFPWPAGFSKSGCYVYITAILLEISGYTFYGSTATVAFNRQGAVTLEDTLGSVKLRGGLANTSTGANSGRAGVAKTLLSWSGLQIKARCDSANPFTLGLDQTVGLYDQDIYYNNGVGTGYLDFIFAHATVICTLRDESTL